VTPDFETIRELFAMSEASSIRVQSRQNGAKGRAALENGDYESAISHFKLAVEQSDSKSPWALMDLGAAYATCDNVPQAFRQYQKAKRVQKSGELMIALAALYQHLGRQNDAILRLKEGVELEPDSAFPHHKLAEALRRAGYRSEALDAAQVAVACAPDQAFYHYWLGEFLLELAKFEESKDALHAAIELSPGDDNLYFLVSQAFWGQGKQQEAIRSIRLASDIDTANMLYVGLLERYLRFSGMVAEADQETRRLSKLEPYDREVLQRVSTRFNLC